MPNPLDDLFPRGQVSQVPFFYGPEHNAKLNAILSLASGRPMPTKAQLEAALIATYQPPAQPLEELTLDSLKPWEPIE